MFFPKKGGGGNDKYNILYHLCAVKPILPYSPSLLSLDFKKKSLTKELKYTA
jgi:hypothetical protein